MPRQTVIQFVIQFAILATIAIFAAGLGVTLGVTDSGYAALLPATARAPAPPTPPMRWAVIRNHNPQSGGFESTGDYLDYLAWRWHAPKWPIDPPAVMICDLCKPNWTPPPRQAQIWRIYGSAY